MRSPARSDLATTRPTWPQVALGLFVVWQLVFLAAANVVEFFPHRPPGRDELIDFPEPLQGMERPPGLASHVATVTDRWAEATGQYQVWWLFAPGFPPSAAFPTVELSWPDERPPEARNPPPMMCAMPYIEGGNEWIRSDFEPTNPRAYFRPPGSGDRYFHYEVRLGLVLLHWDEATARDNADFWRAFRRERVSRQWKSIRAYLRHRLAQFQAEHPDRPPPEYASLHLRLYRTPTPEQPPGAFDHPVVETLARWRVAEDGPTEFLPVEWYDPFARRFERLPRPE